MVVACETRPRPSITFLLVYLFIYIFICIYNIRKLILVEYRLIRDFKCKGYTVSIVSKIYNERKYKRKL